MAFPSNALQVKETTKAAGEKVKGSARAVGDEAKDVGGKIADTAKAAGEKVKGGAATVGEEAQELGGKVKGGFWLVGEKVKEGVHAVEDKSREVGAKGKRATQRAAGRAADACRSSWRFPAFLHCGLSCMR